MSYCTQHAIHIVSEERLKLSDYVRLYEVLAKDVNDSFNPNRFDFCFNNGESPCIVDANWNYGLGMDWPGNFKEDMIDLSKEAGVELKCCWQGEEDSDNGFLHVKEGIVIEEKKMTKENRTWFNKIYRRC